MINLIAQTTTRGNSGKTVYVGIDNPIQVISKDVGCGLELVTVSDNVSMSGDSCNYVLKPANALVGMKIKVRVYAVNANNNEKVLLSKDEYSVEMPPLPTLYFGGIAAENNSITVKRTELMSSQRLVVMYDHSVPFNVLFTLKSFTIIGKKSGKAVKFENNGAYFNNEIKEFFSSLKSKDSFVIDNVKVESAYGSIIRLSPTTIIIE